MPSPRRAQEVAPAHRGCGDRSWGPPGRGGQGAAAGGGCPCGLSRGEVTPPGLGLLGGGLPALAPILLREDEEGKGAGRWWHRYFWAPRDPSPCCVRSAHQANPAGKQHLGFPPLGLGGCKFPQN